MNDKLLLVGSIPLDTVQEVFETFGAPLGKAMATIPDGEVGPRRHWISRIHYQVLTGHPELEIVRRPKPDRVRFGDPGWRLGYARDAINSYFVFSTLRQKGVLAPHLRFQVSLPSVNSVLPPRIFPNTADLDKIKPGYEDALAAEVAKIVEKIPAKDLAIQWDCASEIGDVYGNIPQFPRAGAIERNVAQFKRLSAQIPSGVALGYHLCFGTLGGWPRFSPPDLGEAVNLANTLIATAPRRVDWVHIPVLDRSDDAFFAPLANLRPGDTRIYLGVIHNMARFPERVATARKYLPNFGLAAYCGLGRTPPAQVPEILADHRAALDAT
jgi:hypothetical protein